MRHKIAIACASFLIGTTLAGADPIRTLDAEDHDWDTTPEGVAFAALTGNRFEEAYQAFVRLPSGTVSPPHVKTANMYGVLLRGEMIHYRAGDDPAGARRIGPGSFFSIDGGTPHVSACVSDTDCVTYLYQDGAFDFIAVQP